MVVGRGNVHTRKQFDHVLLPTGTGDIYLSRAFVTRALNEDNSARI